MAKETPDEKLARILKREADKIKPKPALGKIRQQTSKRSPKDTDKKRGDK